MENGANSDGKTEKEEVDKEKDVNKSRGEGERENKVPTLLPSDLHLPVSAEEEGGTSCPPPGDHQGRGDADHCHHSIQTRKPPKRRSALAKRDKRIIEKIRSYYEAAAEAEEDEAEEEDEGEGVISGRRNSFSQIPMGHVRESVSRFDVGGPQGGRQSGEPGDGPTEPIDGRTHQEVEPGSPSGPFTPQSPLSPKVEHDGHSGEQILDFEAAEESDQVKSPNSTSLQDRENPNQTGPNLQSNPNGPLGTKETGKVCKERSVEELGDRQELKTSVPATGPAVPDQAAVAGSRHDPAAPAETSGRHQESSTPLPSTETKVSPTWTRDKHKTSLNSEGLPVQINVGRGSFQSRIVTAHRALFEGMGSDIAGIGFFEASPVVDPSLMANSDRILSKVQILARMYSTKAGTLKVPLHQKLGSMVRNKSSDAAGASRGSTHIHTKIQTQADSEPKGQTEMNRESESIRSQSQAHVEEKQQQHTKYGAHDPSSTTVESRTMRPTRNQMGQIPTKVLSQYQTQTISPGDQGIPEERLIKRAESLKQGRLSFFALSVRSVVIHY